MPRDPALSSRPRASASCSASARRRSLASCASATTSPSTTRWAIWSARRAAPGAGRTACCRSRAAALSPPRSGIGPRAPAIRCCTPTSSSPTARRGRTGDGPRSTPGRSSATPRPPATSTRRACATRPPSELLADRGQPLLPAGVTAHKLRHTFASVLVMLGEDPAHVMGQLGHTDPAFTMRVYTHAMRRDEGAKERMRALVEGRDWARLGTDGPNRPSETRSAPLPQDDESPADAGPSDDGRGGFRTCDLSRVKRALSH